jgi:hypothetical protein
MWKPSSRFRIQNIGMVMPHGTLPTWLPSAASNPVSGFQFNGEPLLHCTLEVVQAAHPLRYPLRPEARTTDLRLRAKDGNIPHKATRVSIQNRVKILNADSHAAGWLVLHAMSGYFKTEDGASRSFCGPSTSRGDIVHRKDLAQHLPRIDMSQSDGSRDCYPGTNHSIVRDADQKHQYIMGLP